jgi:hypothetical protein
LIAILHHQQLNAKETIHETIPLFCAARFLNHYFCAVCLERAGIG